jgi:YfiH family protein
MTVLQAACLAALPGIRHGFFTREGGTSEGPFASLNMGLRGADDRARVLENRRRAAALLGFPLERLVTGYQVHGAHCQGVRAPLPWQEAPEADALATGEPVILLGVVTADCAPVLLADPHAPVVAAAHAGWRGARDGILEHTVASMLEAGARARHIVAAIGPTIGQASYEVGEDYQRGFEAVDAEAGRFFARHPETLRPHFDLAGYCRWRLERAGVGQVESMGLDTAAAEERFFSNRRSSHGEDRRFGLQLSAIGLLP